MWYRGKLIIDSSCDADDVHWHWGDPDEQGRLVVPMNCQGPAPEQVRAYYGPNLGGCGSVEEAMAEIDRVLAETQR